MMTKKSLLSLMVTAALAGTGAFSYVYADDSTDTNTATAESTDDSQKFSDRERLLETLVGWQVELDEDVSAAKDELDSATKALAEAPDDATQQELDDLQAAVDAAQTAYDTVYNSAFDSIAAEYEQYIIAAEETTTQSDGSESEDGTSVLTDEQIFALNRSLNNATNNGLIVNLEPSYLEDILNGDYNKQQINALTKALEEEAKFNKLSDKFTDKYELTGKEHFLDKADMMTAKGERQKDKFLAKIDKFDRSGLETDHKDKAKKAARDSAKSAARDASKNSARKEAKRAAKNEAKKVAKENARKNAKGNNGKKTS